MKYKPFVNCTGNVTFLTCGNVKTIKDSARIFCIVNNGRGTLFGVLEMFKIEFKCKKKLGKSIYKIKSNLCSIRAPDCPSMAAYDSQNLRLYNVYLCLFNQ